MSRERSFMFSSLISVFIFCSFQSCECSSGDSSPSFRSCVRKCGLEHCHSDDWSYYLPNQTYRKWLIEVLWDCRSNCEYECMWPMVHMCINKEWSVPQFDGKWPFVRWLGMQEPASAIFSFLNLVSTSVMYKQFHNAVRVTSALYWIWTAYAIISVNTWFWSIVYHIRDIPFTERMDYIGASSLIYFTFYAFGFRILLFQHYLIKVFFACGCLLFFAQNILHLILKPFDYHYNFDNLLMVGVTAGVGTLLWSIWNWNIVHHVRYATLYVTLTMLVALLEIFDFAPLLWTFDAHSLWHLATVPLPYFLYKFAIEDCRFLRKTQLRASVSTVGRF